MKPNNLPCNHEGLTTAKLVERVGQKYPTISLENVINAVADYSGLNKDVVWHHYEKMKVAAEVAIEIDLTFAGKV